MESQERYGWGASERDDHRAGEFSGNGGDSSTTEPGNEQGVGKGVICPDCGGEFKNLGAHKRFCKGSSELEIDDYLGKSLSFVLESIRQTVKPYSHTIETKVTDENGKYTMLDINIRIPLRR